MHARRFGLFRFRSPLLPKSHVVFSSSGYLDVSVHRVPCLKLCIYLRSTGVFPAGFPHSDICGSMCICHSPQLFAAYHVFLRLLVPRHPPCALIRFTSISIALLIGCTHLFFRCVNPIVALVLKCNLYMGVCLVVFTTFVCSINSRLWPRRSLSYVFNSQRYVSMSLALLSNDKSFSRRRHSPYESL